MTLSFTGRKRFRKYFGHMVEVAEMPNLIEVQKTSYDQFLSITISKSPNTMSRNASNAR